MPSRSQALPDIEPQYRATLRNIAYDVEFPEAAKIRFKEPLDVRRLKTLVKRGLLEWKKPYKLDERVVVTELGRRLLDNFPPPLVGEVVKILVPPLENWPKSSYEALVISRIGRMGESNYRPNDVDVWIPELVPVPAVYAFHVDKLQVTLEKDTVGASSMRSQYEKWRNFQPGAINEREADPPGDDQQTVVDFTRFGFLD